MADLKPEFTWNHSTIPRYFYGTAWKEEKTLSLTVEALQAGFTAIDTANQRKHYYEEAVGLGVQKFLELKNKTRKDLFLQTKFTFARGQDHRKPYQEKDSYTKQVSDSFTSSLAHLQTSYIDSYVLHGPYSGEGIHEEDLETWTAMEKLAEDKKVRFLGVSNVDATQLLTFYENAKIKPSFVQNRCYADSAWDKDVREICTEKGMVYQGFSLLTANQRELRNPLISEIARKYNKGIAQIIFRFCQQLNMICLTGTTNPLHMKSDLEIYDFELSEKEVSQIEKIAF